MRYAAPLAETERIADVDPRGFSHGGWRYSIQPTWPRSMSIPALVWTRENADGQETMTMREVIGAIEDYEPVRSMTTDAIALHQADGRISVTDLKTQRNYMDNSAIVLNRGLREALLRAVASGVTLGEIACRCGRLKKGPRRRSEPVGETSWLLRRCGLAPEGGRKGYGVWVHTDVLALIARDGLGLAPREVEVGVYDEERV